MSILLRPQVQECAHADDERRTRSVFVPTVSSALPRGRTRAGTFGAEGKWDPWLCRMVGSRDASVKVFPPAAGRRGHHAPTRRSRNAESSRS